MRVIKLATGLAIGYVLGSRAGREKYEQIVATARKAQGHPAVSQAQQKAKSLLAPGSGAPTPSIEPVVTDVQETVVLTEVTPTPPKRRPRAVPTPPPAIPGDL